MTNDGTTGIQVAPIQETEDMSHVRSIFDRALNAIVQASELAIQVNELTATVATIKADFEKTVNDLKIEVEHVRSQNRWLDEQLASVRKQRDEAINECVRVNSVLANTNDEHNRAKHLIDTQANTIEALRSQVMSLTKERDDYAQMSQSYSDDLDKAKATLAGIKEKLGWVEPVKHEPEHTTTTTDLGMSLPQPPVQSAPEHDPTKIIYESNPSHEPYKSW